MDEDMESNYRNNENDDDSEDEVFFGPIKEKEKQKLLIYNPRRKTILYPK